MKKVTVLGAGMVGSAIARDLAASFEVTSIDLNGLNLQTLAAKQPAVKTVCADLRDFSRYPQLLQGADWVVTAVPGFMGYKALEAVIDSGHHAVDISFFPENALDLDPLAKSRKVTVITDCGVAPGMSNLILGYHNSRMKIESMRCYVGGLPLHPKPPFFYKAPFSPIDVLEEYTRPARLQIGGHQVVRPALTDREILSFEPVGRLEAFNTDGLRSLLITMAHIPDMIEKTLRFPGHIDLILALQQAGFFDLKERTVGHQRVVPMHLTREILLDQWKLLPGEPEFTIMSVQIEGGGKKIDWHLYDEYDAATGISSMARTTGYTCTAAVNLLANGMFNQPGVFPPELVGVDEACFQFVLTYLSERGVKWTRSF
ncbi:MAG: saccharopine dehydrogenase C-terminal domain-containing protein [Chitinophagaceae bacterium]